ncbi:phage/plasmid primase, P4 family [Candidatus Latescibacterota bacterium]
MTKRKTENSLDNNLLSDIGNAKRLISKYGFKLQYCKEWKSWLHYEKGRWKVDSNDIKITDLAKRTILDIQKQIMEQASLDSKFLDGHEKLIRHVRTSQSARSIENMIKLARSEPGIPISAESLDCNKWLLNCCNGTFNLQNYKFQGHNKKHLLTTKIPVKYDPDAKCPQWEKFLITTFDDDTELIRYLQKAVGYSLTGDTGEQCMFIPHGNGANGKSTFIETIHYMLYSYARKANSTSFMSSRFDRIRNDLARLKGARFVSAVESNEDNTLDEAIIKQMTGQDTIVARFLYQEEFEFDPTWKIWLVTNHKPIIKGTDYAIWRRVQLIPFTQTFKGKDKIKNLLYKLRKELPGILNWAIEGYRLWRTEGLHPPEIVRYATEEYRKEMDVIEDFIDECCVIEPEANVMVSALYSRYQRYCHENSVKPLSKKKFGIELNNKAIENNRVDKERDGYRRYGIRLV